MTPEQAAILAAARTIGRTFGLGITAWVSSAGGGVTGTIVQESKPTFQSAAPGLPPIGVRRWVLVLEVGTVGVGDVLTADTYAYRVAAPIDDRVGIWEVKAQ